LFTKVAVVIDSLTCISKSQFASNWEEKMKSGGDYLEVSLQVQGC